MQITQNLVTTEWHVCATTIPRTGTLAGEVRVHQFFRLNIFPLKQ
jgi:hypothetical protein